LKDERYDCASRRLVPDGERGVLMFDPSSATSTPSTRQDAAFGFSRCTRSHGVSNFPDPDPQREFPAFPANPPKQASAAANDASPRFQAAETRL
jgi:hypothetical protein